MDILPDPNIAYLLLVVGLVLAFLAVLTPGSGVLEAGAVILLLLSLWSGYGLSINLWALALIILGVVPFLVATRRTGKPVYLIASIAAHVLGTVFLIRGESWLPAVDPALAISVSLLLAIFYWIVTSKTLEAIRSQPAHDLEALIGATGEARTDIHEDGTVQVAGELWSARSDSPITSNAAIRVVGREGFILKVEPAHPAKSQP